MPDPIKLFDRTLLRSRRARAAAHWKNHDFLKREAAIRLVDRLSDLGKTFPLALDLGAHRGELAHLLTARGFAHRAFTCDTAPSMRPEVVCDEEFLPFGSASFDLAASAVCLHHVNDLPGTLIQIYHALKPGGLFLASLFGAATLRELRESVTAASAEHDFALSARLSPLVEVRDAGALLQRAGFAEPVADSDSIVVEYDDALDCMRDLRGMGETNILLLRQKTFMPRAHLAAIAEYYRRHFSENGVVTATFELVTLTGWKPL